jgi:hypothetical protein
MPRFSIAVVLDLFHTRGPTRLTGCDAFPCATLFVLVCRMLPCFTFVVPVYHAVGHVFGCSPAANSLIFFSVFRGSAFELDYR